MTVYADEAFLLNGAVDYLLLVCAAKLGGGRILRLRLALAAAFGGVYAAAALFPALAFLQQLPVKLASLAAMLLIAFGAGRGTLRTGALFFAAVCAFGGAAVEMLDCHAENGEYPPECAAELLDARLNRAPCDFTGLLIDTAGAAPGVLEALHAHGLNIPGDLSCIVIDNLTQLDRSNPPLTAVGVDFAELAECMVHHLLDRIHSKCAPAVLELAPRLFDRGSVRKIRKFL